MSDNRFGELGRLTNSETLVIKRRRLGENQTAAAQRYNVTYVGYSKFERGIGDDIPRENIRKLEDSERCFLYRRRCGFTQATVAKDLQVCRYWLNLMERGEKPCDPLIWYWEQ